MKKFFVCILTIVILCIGGIYATATGIWGSVCVFDEIGNRCYGENLDISIGFIGEIEYQLSSYGNLKLWRELDEEIKSLIFSNLGEGEYFTIFELKYGNIDNIEETDVFMVTINSQISYGGKSRAEMMGNDYRLYYLKDNSLEEIEIKRSDKESVRFENEKTGIYILYYNPNIYDVKFYDEYPENSTEPFYGINDLGKYDIVEFPEIPEKEGYVFTGWKHDYWEGRYTKHSYIEPSQLTAFDLWEVYASWCPEDEYTPLEIVIESEEKIKKGKEDGSEIILTLSEGRFDDVIDNNVGEDWMIVGSDELSIARVERIDDTTARLTLSGNSSDKYKSSEIQIKFNSALYISHEGFGNNGEVHEIADIQLDEKGIKKARFISDNSITLEKQKKSGTGGGVEKHTVAFETNGGEEIQSVRVANGHSLNEPERVLKEGYTFAGWYTDEELTTPYNFESGVKEDFTIYAAWEKPELKEPDNKQIILPIRFIEKAIELLKAIMN